MQSLLRSRTSCRLVSTSKKNVVNWTHTVSSRWVILLVSSMLVRLYCIACGGGGCGGGGWYFRDTVLLRLLSDISDAIDIKHHTLFRLQDMSTVFDTVDNKIL